MRRDILNERMSPGDRAEALDELAHFNPAAGKKHRRKLPKSEAGKRYVKYLRGLEMQHAPPEVQTHGTAAYFLAKVLRECAEETVQSAVRVTAYLRTMARLATVKPITFASRSDFDIVNGAFEQKAWRHALSETVLKGTFTIYRDTVKRDISGERDAIVSKLIQSLDAAMLHKVVLLAGAAGIRGLATIHDAFGTHASDMSKLQECIMQAFCWLCDGRDVLSEFHEQALKSIDPDKLAGVPIVPERGALDLRGATKSRYMAH